ncbi:Clan SB, family S8, subtilisin-like serine peptidase [Trichomonas vaginalis G3]|uniref:Clan SB, family S8, subtilisin-like serine peptidase n=1 Tax=Trichomonas vaginalis (strain ATCC PRA-98 / G3) TaxID=412133 RepID=A2DMC5_TRIV3|nr:peptidase S8 family [Trichomonas vaginalis G3]EAY18352.1 Clan SB, family S8, subtilisin-like serine peptidase [Trichomonas vaginalis G3]KAI5524185.1 peptidase S8 family [Trichomonas vaginalis G3]|eukprot:XP_001579338.1 Clan SB, family S8, subtilisin-like serine peptidase [Trichomonas vaginalis G3]
MVYKDEIIKYKLKYSDKKSYYIHTINEWAQINHCEFFNTFVYQCNNISDELVLEAYNDPRVLKIEPIQNIQLQNRFSVGLLQNGIDKVQRINNMYQTDRTITKMGITGKKQVVTIIDTVLDVNHTFFYDPYHKVSSSMNSQHRKVVKYFSLFDNHDAINGHGTHIAGIVAGKALESDSMQSLYSGVAEGAKLHVIDIGNDKNEITVTPNPNTFQENMKDTTSKIQTSSWGFDNNNLLRNSFDEIAFNNQDTVYIASAGNRKSAMSVFPPGNSKNFITVGALADSTVSSFTDTADIYVTNGETKIKVLDPQKFMSKYSGPQYVLTDLTVSSDSASRDTAYVCTQNECPLIQGHTFRMMVSFAKPNYESPYPFLITETKSQIDMIAKWTTLSVIMEPSKTRELQVADFSSWGPTEEGILKPEVIAPGTSIVSAKSLGKHDYHPLINEENLVKQEGTSMAAPMVAGLAALIKDYFYDGFYPTLSPKIQHSKNPSGYLVKAMIINGCTSTTGAIVDNKSGFGLVNAEKSLGFGSNKGIRVTDNIPIGKKKHISSKIKTDTKQDLSITISYVEPPLQNSNIPLNIGLNLIVEDSKGKSYFANGLEEDREEEFTTNHRVFIPNAPPDTYKIHVYSQNYMQSVSVAKFAIVITGGFKQDDYYTNPVSLTFSDEENCPSNCNSGTCNSGFCSCPYDKRGLACQTYIAEAPPNKDYVYNASSRYVNWMRLAITDKTNVSFIMFGIGVNPLIAISDSNNVKLEEARTAKFQFSLSAQQTRKQEFRGHWLYFGFFNPSATERSELPIRIEADFAPGSLVNSSLPEYKQKEGSTAASAPKSESLDKYIAIVAVTFFAVLGIALLIMTIVIIVRKRREIAMIEDELSKKKQQSSPNSKNNSPPKTLKRSQTNRAKPAEPENIVEERPSPVPKSESVSALQRMQERRRRQLEKVTTDSENSERD